MDINFEGFPKIARLSRDCIVTEKIDGTNAQIRIEQDGTFLVGSRTRWITPEQDNMGFANWAYTHKEELMLLGPGSHFGEWWGAGIQRKYDLKEKRFSLFNTERWVIDRPPCCGIVPVLYKGLFDTKIIDNLLIILHDSGSLASPGFMKPEGIVVFHTSSRKYFKKTLDKEDKGKWQV